MSTLLQMTGRVMDYTHRPKNQDDTEVRALVNDAYVFVCSQLRCFQVKTASISLTAADGDYSLVTDLGLTDFASLRVVQYTAANGSMTLSTLAPTTTDEVLSLRQLNPSATSPAVAYALEGWETILLHPLPATGDTLTVVYAARPALMSADTDTPTRIPEEWHHLIVQRAAGVAMEVMDDRRSLLLKQEFQAELAQARLWFNQNASTRGFAPTTGQRPVLWPSDYFSGMS